MVEAVVLAGGKGERLRELTGDRIPKPMVEIKGVPFLHAVLNKLRREGIYRVVLSVGHLKEVIIDHFGHDFCGMKIEYCVEDEPLGTGGALKQAGQMIKSSNFLVTYGDTLHQANTDSLVYMHETYDPLITMLTPVREGGDFGRAIYESWESPYITQFIEKSEDGSPFINGATMIVNKKVLDRIPEGKSDFSYDVLPILAEERQIVGYRYSGFFVDIGTPEAVEALKKELGEGFNS